MKDKIVAPFGQWQSPIVSSMTVRVDKSVRNADILVKDGNVYWTETRPLEKGRTALVCKKRNETVGLDLIPSEFDVRSKVHEYGGAPYTVYQDILYFIHSKNQVLYRRDKNGAIEPLTDGKIRFANLQGCAKGVIAVAEEHIADKVDNYFVLISDSGQIKTLHQGYDFYASPTLTSDGKQLAWLMWNHPNMPWDGTELWVADIDDDTLINQKKVVGGIEESIYQPLWSPKGILYYISDQSGWWNIYRNGEKGIENVYPLEAEFGLPLWRFGMSTWAFTGHEDEIIFSYQKNGFSKLGLLNPTTHDVEMFNLPYTDYSQISVENDIIVMLMGSPTSFRRVMQLDLKTRLATPLDTQETLDVDSRFLSYPKNIEFPTTLQQTAFGYYYAPFNRDYQGPEGQLPPLIVFSHGGPTGCADPTFNLRIQYWTSRGFAVLDVNYRGSTGFGREYRKSLQSQWGVLDVQDCEKGALYLVEQGLVDKDHIFIRGGSAGGYTTLAALAFTNTFSAGASYYGVGDLLTLVQDTHKFESRYLDRLIGPLPEFENVYFERSPLFHADRIKCPVIFFQGDNDKIVPKNQAELMYQALVQNQIPTKLILYENEEHGFRQAKNIEDSLNQELAFYLERLR